MKEKVLEALRNDKTICVNNVWYFTGRYMECCEGPQCCQDYYGRHEEAWEAMLDYANNNLDLIEILED